MYYNKHSFLMVGLPFLTAMVFGTFFLGDVRKSRYETPNLGKQIVSDEKKRTMKSLEEELKEWEEKHKKKVEEFKSDYEMKPVRG